MKINANIMIVLSMVLLLTLVTGSTAYDVDSLDSIQDNAAYDVDSLDSIQDNAAYDVNSLDSIQDNAAVNNAMTDKTDDLNENETPTLKEDTEKIYVEYDNENPNLECDNENLDLDHNNESHDLEGNNEKFIESNCEAFSSQQIMENKELKDHEGIVMADDEYSCGPAALATALNRYGLNLTLKDVSCLTDTTPEKGTSMLSLINASKHFGFECAGVMIDASLLKENFIVHMNIDGIEHWSVIRNISDGHVFLLDPNEGNVNFTLEEFAEYYTGSAIMIFNAGNESIQEELKSKNITLLSNEESTQIFGKRMVKKIIGYKTVKKYGLVQHYGWKLMPVVSKGEVHFSQWQYVKGYYYTPGWYTTKEPIYKVYTISDDALTSASIKNVKKTSKTLKASSKTKKLQASKKAVKKKAKKTKKKSAKKTTKKNKK